MQQAEETPQQESQAAGGVSRLTFLIGSGSAIAGAGLTGLLSGCSALPPSSTSSEAAPETTLSTPESLADRYPEVQAPPSMPPPLNVLHVFTPEEALLVDALTARIFPGDANDPGAHEAGVVTYIDTMLSFSHGDVEPTYRRPPFTRTYTSDTPPAVDTVNGYKVMWVAQDAIERYGYQSIQTPRESYRIGLAAVDAYARQKFGASFTALSTAQQDAIVADLASGAATGFTDPSAEQFFQMLRTNTIEGMFSDPLYGGNRDLVGWKLVGYPGAQRAYTEADMKDPFLFRRRPPQSLANMMPFNPGENANSSVILPVDGSRQK
jgi:gluconate 2-dehydrogenase gamma chain